jgi:hypothetical protein
VHTRTGAATGSWSVSEDTLAADSSELEAVAGRSPGLDRSAARQEQRNLAVSRLAVLQVLEKSHSAAPGTG